MKKILVFILFLFATSLFCQKSETKTLKGPKISAPVTVKDFGEIVEGEILKHDFVIKNEGDEDLIINKVRASCGCTAAKLEKDTLAAGDSENISVRFNSSHRSGMQRKHVYIFSNDKEKPQFRISFSVKVIPKAKSGKNYKNAARLNLSSNQYNFSNVTEGTVAKGTLNFVNGGKSNLIIKNIKSTSDCTKANFAKNEFAPGEKGEIVLTFDTEGRKGQMSRTIIIESNDPISPKQVVTLFINVQPRNS